MPAPVSNAASFAMHRPDIRSRFSMTCTGHMIVVNLPPEIEGTVALMVDEADMHAIERLLAGSINPVAGVEVTDLILRESHWVTVDECGSGCRCALRFGIAFDSLGHEV